MPRKPAQSCPDTWCAQSAWQLQQNEWGENPHSETELQDLTSVNLAKLVQQGVGWGRKDSKEKRGEELRTKDSLSVHMDFRSRAGPRSCLLLMASGT